MAGVSKKKRITTGMAPIFDEVVSPESIGSRTAWLLTNRNNLVEVLASGLVKPAHLAPRHYADLASQCPGYLPLLLHYPAPEWCEQVSSEGDSNFPVLLQIKLNGLVGPGYLITGEQTAEFDGPLSAQTADVILVHAVVPAQFVTQIVFADDSQRSNVMSNHYDNVPDTLLRRSRVDPQAFAGEARVVLVPALRAFQLDSQTQADEQQLCMRVEKIAGGLALAATALSQRSALSFAAIVHALNLLAGHVVAGETQISLAVAHLLGAPLNEESRRSPNQLLLVSAAEFAASCTSGFSPRDLIRQTYDRAIRLFGESSTLPEQLQSALSVLEDEQTQNEFEQLWPRKPYPVANALLRFALRRQSPPTYSELVEGEANTAEVTSWFLTGLFLGRARLSVETYPEGGLMRALDACATRFINRLTGGLNTPDALEFQLMYRVGQESVLQDGVEIARFAHRGPFEEAVDYFRQTATDQISEEAAIAFCRIMGWANCVHAEVTGLISGQKDDLAMKVSGRDERKITVSFTGFVREVQHRLKPAEFRRHLASPLLELPSKEAIGALDALIRGLRDADK